MSRTSGHRQGDFPPSCPVMPKKRARSDGPGKDQIPTGGDKVVAVPRARGRRSRLRPVGWRGDADLRRAGRLEDQAGPGPPRAGRHPHGRRLRARDRPAGVVLVTSGPGATNTVTGPADRADGLGADDRPLRPDHHPDAGQGRLPGGRRHRHHLPGGQAQLPGQERQRHPARHEGGVLHRHHRPAGPGAHRPAEGRDQRRRARRRSSTPSNLPGYHVPGRADPDAAQEDRRAAGQEQAARCSTSATAR